MNAISRLYILYLKRWRRILGVAVSLSSRGDIYSTPISSITASVIIIIAFCNRISSEVISSFNIIIIILVYWV